MKRTVLVAALASAVVLGAAAEGFSQVSLYMGAYGGTSSQTPSAETFTFDTDTTFVYGLRAGLRVLMLGVELSYFQAAHNIDVSSGLPSWDGKVNDYSYIGLNGKLYFSLLVVHPYLTLGYGYYTADIHNIDKDNDGGFNFGGGVEVKLGGKFGLSAEAKWHKVSVDIQSIDLDLGDFTLTAGFNFYF